MPDAARAGLEDSSLAYPVGTTVPSSDIVFTISAGHRQFAFARLPESHLTGSSPAVSASLTTTAVRADIMVRHMGFNPGKTEFLGIRPRSRPPISNAKEKPLVLPDPIIESVIA